MDTLRASAVLPIAVMLGLLGGQCLAQVERVVIEPTPEQVRTVRLLIFCVDFVGSTHEAKPPVHQNWQTAAFISNAFFGTNPHASAAAPPAGDGVSFFALPTGSGGRRLGSCSIAQYFTYNVPGTRLAGQVFRFPSSSGSVSADGWYQLSITDEQARRFFASDEAGWGECCRAVLTAAGFGGDVDHPRFMRPEGGGYHAAYIIHGGGGGSVRTPFGWEIGSSGLGNDPTDPHNADESRRYAWLGTACHELMHWIGDCPTEMYGHVMQSYNLWEILSVGNALGAYPAPATGWFRLFRGFARAECRLLKGCSTHIVLPRPSITSLAEIAVLDNSSVGDGDAMVVEYRDLDPSDPAGRTDSAGMGVPAGTRPGLLVMDYDRYARGFFHSDRNENGAIPAAFGEATLGGSINAYPLTPTVDIKRHDGTVESEQGDLFPDGSACEGSYCTDPVLLPEKSSANRDGDVIWELRNLRTEGRGFGFDARFAGRSLAVEAMAETASWRSGSGAMRRTTTTGADPNGSYYEQYVFRAMGGEQYYNVLWVTMPTAAAGGNCFAEAAFSHQVPPTGERLTGRIAFGDGHNQVLRGQARVQVTWEPVSATGGSSGPVRLLDGSFQAAEDLPEFSVDLTPLAGASGLLRLRVEAAPRTAVGLAGAYFYAKAEAVLYDMLTHAGNTRGLSASVSRGTNVTDPDGVVGIANNVRLVDGVLYSRALFTKPQTVDRGKARIRWGPIRIPDTGAVLRGSVGCPVEAIGGPVQHGSLVRIAIDDGVHKVPLREWPTPLVAPSNTMLCRGRQPDGQGRPTVETTPQYHWRDGLAWGGEVWRTWTGDWLRVGDFDGDLSDDIAVFTGGSTARVGVCLSRAGAPRFRRWHDWFAPASEYPLVGRLDSDDRDDIITFTPDGDVYGAVTRGEAFQGTGQCYAESLIRATEVPAMGDVDGDGYDDVVIFDRDNVRGLGAGVVLVARNNHAGRFANPQVAYSGNFCAGWRVPMVADLDGDHHADIVCADYSTGDVYAALQQGTGFAPARVWLRAQGPQFTMPTVPRATPTSGLTVGFTGPFPGPEALGGPIPFLVQTRAGTDLIWFNRSCFTDARKAKVYAAHAVAGPGTAPGSERFTDPATIHSFFGTDEEWPLVGDFDGDGRVDLTTTVPGYYTCWNKGIPWIFYARQPEEPRIGEVKWPGDLYVSAKPGTVHIPGIPPRVHRFAIDLAEFRGRDISIEISVDAGPPCPNDDLLYWPDLRLCTRASAPLAVAGQVAPMQQVGTSTTGAATPGAMMPPGGQGGTQPGGNLPGKVQQPGETRFIVPRVVAVTDRSVSVEVLVPGGGLKGECLFSVLDGAGQIVAQSPPQAFQTADKAGAVRGVVAGLMPGTVYLVRMEGIVGDQKLVTDPEKFATTGIAQTGPQKQPDTQTGGQTKPLDQQQPGTAEGERWRLEVLGATRMQEYTQRHCGDKKTISAQEKDETLLIVNCRLINLHKEVQVPVLSERLPGRTCVYDAAGNALVPVDYDAAQASNKWQDYAAAPVKPGGAAEFALVFRMPAKSDPRVMVFTILNYPQDVGAAGTDVKLELPR